VHCLKRVAQLYFAIFLIGCQTQTSSGFEFNIENIEPENGNNKKAVSILISAKYFNLKTERQLEDNDGFKIDNQFVASLQTSQGNQTIIPLEQVVYIDEMTLSAVVPPNIDSAIYTLAITDPYGNTARLSNAYTATAGALLEGALSESTTKLAVGNFLNLTLQVTNTGDASALGTKSSTPNAYGAGGVILLDSTNISIDLEPGATADFLWIYQAVELGIVTFTCSAGSISEDSNDTIALQELESQQIMIVECLANSDCMAGKSWCEVTQGVCVECLQASHCTDADPCTTNELCIQNSCVIGDYDKDFDSDGYIDIDCGGDDCDDNPNECGADCNPQSQEVCDNFDNDCDTANNDGDDDPLLNQPCDGTDADLCAEGTYIGCSNAALVCDDNSSDNLELCDGTDNDCDTSNNDGDADPLLNQPCDGTDADLCFEGLLSQCIGGALVCDDNSSDNLEICDGADNDCDTSNIDGDEDTLIGQLCDGTDDDMCLEGKYTHCASGALACDDNSSDDIEGLVSVPSCLDSIDNDCDGDVDSDDIDCVDFWWDPNWNLRRKITFDNSSNFEDLTSFPILVKLEDSWFDFAKVLPDGDDIRFVDSNEIDVLHYEIESWNDDGVSHIWVNIPQIDEDSAIDYIWMYYGYSWASSYPNPQQTWTDDFEAVYHLRNTADSTSNVFNATSYGANPTSGKIDGAYRFDGTNDYIDMGSDLPMLMNASACTLSAWVYPSSIGIEDYIISISINNGGILTDESRATMGIVDFVNIIAGGRSSDTEDYLYIEALDVIKPDNWYFVATTIDYENDEIFIFVDGELVLSGQAFFSEKTTPDTVATSSIIGANDDQIKNFVHGTIDEVRVSGTSRSKYWIHAQYLSMTGSYIQIGDEETVF